MPCENIRKPNQTRAQRAADIRAMVARLDAGLLSNRYSVTVGPQGAIAFLGLSEAERDGVSDACAYRYLLVSGSALAKAKMARAEQVAGHAVNRQALAAGWHSHDGTHWHKGH